MHRLRRPLIVALVMSLLAGPLLPGLGAPSRRCEAAAEVADLRETLESGLRARLPQDFAFIGLVIKMVEANQLPRSLVLSTYQWVRRKKKTKRYLVPYFESALRLRAKEKGITIP